VETTSPADVESEVTVSTDEASPADATAEATPLSEPVGEQVADEFGPDSAAPLEDGAAPEGFEIKGNKNSMKFHAPSSPWYARTNAEVWFRTAEAAEAAGFANAESGDTTEATDTTEA
jgi:hypothetical protein